MQHNSLLDFSAFSRPVLLQLSNNLARCVFLPEGPQVLRRQWGAVSFHNKAAEGLEGGRWITHAHEWQQNTQFTVNRCPMLLWWAGCRKWWCEEKAYPVNHQKRIFDRKDASLTGHGFWNISNNRLTAVFTVNDLIIKSWTTFACEGHLQVRVFIELLCSISTIQLSFCQVSTSNNMHLHSTV